jgi:hypothetical protein
MTDSNPPTPTTTLPPSEKMYTDEIARLREGTDLLALCKVCNRRYKAITEHIRSKHPEEYLLGKSTGEKLYEKIKITCKFCGFHPSTANSLVNHINCYHIKGNPLLNPATTQAPPATTQAPPATTPASLPVANSTLLTTDAVKKVVPLFAKAVAPSPKNLDVSQQLAQTESPVTLKVPLQLQVDTDESPILATLTKQPQRQISDFKKKMTLSLKKPVADNSVSEPMENKITPLENKITTLQDNVANSITVTSLPDSNGKMNFSINIQLSISQN